MLNTVSQLLDKFPLLSQMADKALNLTLSKVTAQAQTCGKVCGSYSCVSKFRKCRECRTGCGGIGQATTECVNERNCYT